MTVGYFDSSVLIAMLLKEARSEQAGKLWAQQEARVSSLLLSAECWVTMRRHFLRLGTESSASWLEERGEFLQAALGGMELKRTDEEILELIRKEPRLAECRTLDAIHLATALLFKSRMGEGFALVSFDQKMRETAGRLGLSLLPS